ncbi:zinc ribbon domain-containing protein [Haloferula helveola]|uniref:zinc ribbon domain-containing protein n=1 Tax=Haloferula helveola TaxID=490095 RepID=UPI0031B89D7F
MKKTIGGIGAGLKAVAKSLVTPATRFQVGDNPLLCPICRHDEFDRREMLMNTSGMSFMNMDWLNSSACALVCQKCKHIELFAETPSERSV